MVAAYLELLDQRVPLAAVGAPAEPLERLQPAGLAGEVRLRLRHALDLTEWADPSISAPTPQGDCRERRAAKPSRPVAEHLVDSCPFHHWHVGEGCPAGVSRNPLNDLSRRVYKSADPGGRRSEKPAVVLGAAQRRQLQMLLLLVPRPIPGIIRQVDQRLSPATALIFHRLAHQGREDVLVADESGELPWAKSQWGGGFSAGQVRRHR